MFWPCSWIQPPHRFLKLPLFFLAMLAWSSMVSSGHAAPTQVALLNGSATLSGLAACLATRVGDSGPLVQAEALSDGLEFRLSLRAEPRTPALLIIQGLLKPDVAGLLESHDHGDDPEAQPAAAKRFFQLLRIPVGTRAWVWQPQHEGAICSEAALWISHLRSHPILFDRLGPGGNPD